MKLRFRHVYMFLLSALAILCMIAVDPDQGFITQLPFAAGAVATLAGLFKVTLYIAMVHMARKGLLDYVNFKELFELAKIGNVGAGLACIAVALVMVAAAIVVAVVV